jgi:methanethiol S-methyltransferase
MSWSSHLELSFAHSALFAYLQPTMPRLDLRKLLFLQFAIAAVLVAVLGLAAFALMLWDFQFPGTFKEWYLFRGGMPQNLLLLLAFGFQHSIMARQGFKKVMTRLMPIELERSFYVMLSGFVLFTLSLLWSPSAPPLYDLSGTFWGYLLLGLALLGLPIMGLSLVAVDALDLVGIRSVLRILRDEQPVKEPLKMPQIYRFVRHPLYLGMLMLFWFTPAMTHDHLFFAEVMTAYLLIGIQFEERDLVATYGEAYKAYQAQVPMLIPFLRRPRKK